MDANNNPPSARVSMTIKMPFECHHETELYAYMYGADVQFLEVDGLNHVNQLWESYYILHRTGRRLFCAPVPTEKNPFRLVYFSSIQDANIRNAPRPKKIK